MANRRILVITRKVDVEDDIAGFFHRWVEKLSEKFDFLNVICLESGRYSLPDNVKVFSLGKEHGRNRKMSLCKLYRYVWQLRKDYDAVFVHMNPIYVVLAGVFWKLSGKKIFLWHNHKQGNIITRLAIWLSDVVFYTSPQSFSSRFEKSKIMPVGIDTEMFKNSLRQAQGKQNSVLYLGRFSPVKNVDVLIEAADLLDKQGVDFILNIVGEPAEDELGYFNEIKERTGNLETRGKIRFFGKVANYKTPEIYNQNDIFVNLTQAGSFDKTILEAMACQSMVLASNPVFEEIFSKDIREILMFKERDAADLAQKIIYLMRLPLEQKEKIAKDLRDIVVKNHSLDILAEKLCANFGI